ncbi:sulfatase/phosphatase domain-containing protein [Paenibacillus anseongensis]|uniref:sulfatase/phosphatase domain-containing protein n=1 Tax=Paenibacillus TaxID=44249 RepID=UPI0030B910A4
MDHTNCPFNCQRSCHESSIRVPLAFSGPGFNGGGALRELISLIDLPPTLLDAAGIEVPDHMQGRSLMPLIGGNRMGVAWQQEVFVQISESEVGRAIRTRRWKYAVTAPSGDPIHDSRASDYVESYLYDLEADPYELNNLVDKQSHEEVRVHLREVLKQRMVTAGETAPTIHALPAQASGQLKVLKTEIYQ